MPTAAEARGLASYNRWANNRLYDAAATLSPQRLAEDRGAFFSSVLGTLNHLLVTDRIWLGRFEGNVPTSLKLNSILHDNLADLRQARIAEDERIERFMARLTDQELAAPFTYRNMSGQEHTLPMGDIITHLFNHQTHHRGQATTLLTQAGVEYPPLDYLYYVIERKALTPAPEAAPAPAG